MPFASNPCSTIPSTRAPVVPLSNGLFLQPPPSTTSLSEKQSPRAAGVGDERPSPTYLDDAAPAGQAARLVFPGEGAGGRGGRGERPAVGSPGRAGPGFVPGHAEAAVSVGNPAAVTARQPVAEATSPAAAAFPGSGFQDALGAEGRARGGGQGPAGGAPPTALRHGRPATRQHKAASPSPRLAVRGPSSALLPPPAAASSAFFLISMCCLLRARRAPGSRAAEWGEIPAGGRKGNKSAPRSPLGTWEGKHARHTPGTRAAAGAENNRAGWAPTRLPAAAPR